MTLGQNAGMRMIENIVAHLPQEGEGQGGVSRPQLPPP